MTCLCLLVLQPKKYAARGRPASAQQKARRGVPPGRSGVVSVNTLFWKILVTRVKRKMRAAGAAARKARSGRIDRPCPEARASRKSTWVWLIGYSGGPARGAYCAPFSSRGRDDAEIPVRNGRADRPGGSGDRGRHAPSRL